MLTWCASQCWCLCASLCRNTCFLVCRCPSRWDCFANTAIGHELKTDGREKPEKSLICLVKKRGGIDDLRSIMNFTIVSLAANIYIQFYNHLMVIKPLRYKRFLNDKGDEKKKILLEFRVFLDRMTTETQSGLLNNP